MEEENKYIVSFLMPLKRVVGDWYLSNTTEDQWNFNKLEKANDRAADQIIIKNTKTGKQMNQFS